MIPIKEYKRIVDRVPILCVDAVIVKDGKYLLVRRANEPLKGKYWTPGGRVLKGESLAEAVVRKVFEETGLKVKPISIAGVYEDFYEKNTFDLPFVHTASVVFVCSVVSGEVALDFQSDGFKWSDTLPKDLKLQMQYF